MILVPIQGIGVHGAAISSVACHMVAFIIAITVLRKTIKLNLTFSKFIIKPVISVTIMAICSYFSYITLSGIIATKLATILSILIAVVIYIISIIALKVLSKEEMEMIPGGSKVYNILEKLKIYEKK